MAKHEYARTEDDNYLKISTYFQKFLKEPQHMGKTNWHDALAVEPEICTGNTTNLSYVSNICRARLEHQ
jgi:hypothetical protein